MAAPIRDKCRSCGAEIMWVPNERTQKMAPIEATPRPDGNVYLSLLDPVLETHVATTADEATHYHVMTKAEKADADAGRHPELVRFVSHFVTCEDSPHWRDREGRADA